jgi:hypothetical protein
LTFPPTIGRICHKIHARMSQLKADQVCNHAHLHNTIISTLANGVSVMNCIHFRLS